ncbi:hypothetical protein D3Y57_16355 [Sphingomonas paeninsulae]|uniref:DUF3617 family protein n=1 Tax=Sphingomonas paeninsulae TaxID=2319844 RepID=A0A494TCM5_SPHPE|nr:hypothetical protein [Sphingomonas paeninsulae]AYJ87217.1 hypothetical protein D3Y57_16355 [Sphingomonas paeninsulae]
MTPFFKMIIATAAVFLATAAEAPLIALSQIEPGQWSLVAAGARTRSICLSDPRVLLQLQHTGIACSRYVIENDKDSTIVHYACPGAGHGRTEVKVETPRLIQILSQGISKNAPFDWALEGRRTGPCAPTGQR